MNDGPVWIATGFSRKETKWKNKEMLWSQLVEKLKTTRRTPETIKEYLGLKKDQQDQIKDVGGFVGGTITGGRRVLGSVSARYLITLDIDEGSAGFIDDLLLTFNNALCVYSTHKHTPEKPRLRVVMPLNREVMTDEYEAVSRKIAELVDIEQFDPTTFQPERLMYWPSTATNGEFVFEFQDGPWLDPDKILAKYSDWRDMSQWAVKSTAKERVKKGVGNQGEPTEKPGIIGTFCRMYGITAAIEKFLPDVYEPTAHEDRYSLIGASTASGLVVYEDKFAYSHHATDPASERLCNSFDLVRLHKFGERDKNSGEGVPINKLPSYVAMTDFAAKDPDCKKELIIERLAEANEDFKNARDEGSRGVAEDDLDWIKELETDKKGNCLNTIKNVKIILENDPKLKDNLYYNEFDKRILLKRGLPWRKITRLTNEVTEADAASFRDYFEQLYHITVEKKIEDAITIIAHRNTVHPVKDYLMGLKWDGVERLERLLIDYLGSEDTDYVRAVTVKTFVAGVARIFDPGVKFDYILTLIGSQGMHKSELVSRMARQWFSDTFGSLQNNSAMEQIQGVWIMEIAELAGFKKAEAEIIKLFVSKTSDRFRVAYGRRVESFPRQCIFIGTTNEDQFLHDTTGNRRFWPVKLSADRKYNVFKDLTSEVVGQLWGEAKYLYTRGEALFLSEEMESVAKEVQEEHAEHDERTYSVIQYLNLEVPGNWYDLGVHDRRAYLAGDELIGSGGKFIRDKISIPEIWTELLLGQPKDMNAYNTKSLRAIMSKFKNWTIQTVRTKEFGVQKGYVRIKEKSSKS